MLNWYIIVDLGLLQNLSMVINAKGINQAALHNATLTL